MKKNYIILLGFLLLSYLNAGAQAWEWAKGVSNARGVLVVSDSEGSIYLGGNFKGSCHIPGASIHSLDSAIFIAKYTDAGQLIWHKKMEAEQVELHALQFFSGEVYVGGWFTDKLHADQQFVSAGKADIFIARINSEGAYTLFKTDGGVNDEYLLTISVYNSYILCGGDYFGEGVFGSTTLSSIAPGGRRNTFFARYAHDGSLAWAKAIRPKENNHWGAIQYVKADPAGNVYVLGSFEGQTDYGGVDSAFYYCQIVVKYNASGNFLDFLFCSGDYAHWVKGMEFDDQGHIYILKSVGGNHSHDGNRLSKYLSSGKMVWSRTVGGGNDYGQEGACIPKAMALRNGMVYITGWFSGRITLPSGAILSGSGIYVFKYDANGNLVMVRNSNGGGYYADGGSIGVDNAGNVYIAGEPVDQGASFGDAVFGPAIGPGILAVAKLSAALQESRPSIILEPQHYSECVGKTFQLKATVQNVTMIKWYLPGGHTPYTGEEFVYHVNPARQYDSAGVYSAYVIISNSAYRDSIAFPGIITISNPEVPVIAMSNAALVCTGDSVDWYEWFFNNDVVHYGTGNTYQPVAEGTYKVRVRYMNGCHAMSEPFTYSTTMNTNEMVAASDEFLVFPNPGNGDFSVVFPPEMKDKKVMIILKDLSGRVVAKRSVDRCESSGSIHAKGIAKGIYLFTVEVEGRSFNKRVVVQ